MDATSDCGDDENPGSGAVVRVPPVTPPPTSWRATAVNPIATDATDATDASAGSYQAFDYQSREGERVGRRDGCGECGTVRGRRLGVSAIL